MSGPTLELLVGLHPVTAVEPVLRALARIVTLRAPEPRLPPPDARLATSTDANGIAAALRDDAVPIAVTLRDGEEPPADVAARAAALLVARRPDAPGIPSFGAPVVAWPEPSIDAAAHPPLPPLVRRRWRRLLGLPDPFVVVLGFDPATPLPAGAVRSALATCDVAAVRGPATLLALALGTPVVTDATTARGLGARDDREVVVAPPAGASATAHSLVADERRLARLGTAARQLVEQVHDVAPSARAVARRLGVLTPEQPRTVVHARLAELGTAAGALPAVRALAACEPFVSVAPMRRPA
ncbi:MAG: hypothetical protein JOZ99_06345 [Actinobacteria bacterium]|nr:hypothetical protein [Actinomycetota bacterium]